MLPLVDKPLIQYVVEEAVASGIEDIVIVTGRGKTAIEDHFDVSYELERFLEEKGKLEELAIVRGISELIRVSYVRQKEALGLGHAILAAEPLVGEEAFAVLLGDDLIDGDPPCIGQLVRVFERFRAPVVAIERIPGPDIASYGVIASEPLGEGVHRITDMVEKPDPAKAPSDLAIIGRYVLTPDVFPQLKRTEKDAKGEIQLTNGLRSLLADRPVYGLEFRGRRYDCGHKLGFLKATVEYALKRSDLGADFSRYLRSLIGV
jgi:UTP--glucose-1-phosphate uridylyltransferase